MLLSSFSEEFIEAGCDEAGRGCLAGPVVAAAVILPKNYTHALLNDSKQLTKAEREGLREDIERDALSYAVAEISNLEIDSINILNASFKAMHAAIDRLRIRPTLLLIDGNRFSPYDGIKHECIIKGDGKYLSIAAELMSGLSTKFPGYGWETNMGYPTDAHRNGIRKQGITPYHRKSFQLLPPQLDLFASSELAEV